jgi:hypothetical protein
MVVSGKLEQPSFRCKLHENHSGFDSPISIFYNRSQPKKQIWKYPSEMLYENDLKNGYDSNSIMRRLYFRSKISSMKKFESYSNNKKILTEFFFLVVNGLWLNCLSFSGIKSLFVLVIGMKKSDQWELQEEREMSECNRNTMIQLKVFPRRSINCWKYLAKAFFGLENYNKKRLSSI